MATNSRAVDLGDVRLAIAEAGTGGRPLMLVHGFTGAKEDFTDFLEPLAEQGWHAVAPDLRGHGASDHPAAEESYSLAVFAADVLALADELGWGRFVLLGHSMGGMVAQHLLLAAPERVRGVVLMDTTHGPIDWVEADTAELAAAVVRQQGIAALMEALKLLRAEDPLMTPAFLRLLNEKPGYSEFCDAKLLASAPSMWLAMAPALLTQPDRLDRLAGVGVPTLVIVGEQDIPFIAHGERMAKTIPGARLVIIPDAGHSPQFENMDAWWVALSSFLEAVA
jgi:2-succinyl-6-hydroxy-2,4-cyclohexadiene-1-carboxylate synthase